MTLSQFFQPRRWPWRLLVLEAMVWLTLSVVAVRLVPFRRLAPLLGPAAAPGEGRSGTMADEAQKRLARHVGAAVRRGARALPGRVLCLPQAMAAKAMLGRRGIPAHLHLGAVPVQGPAILDAHAWVTVDGMPVTGGGGADYAELVRFG